MKHRVNSLGPAAILADGAESKNAATKHTKIQKMASSYHVSLQMLKWFKGNFSSRASDIPLKTEVKVENLEFADLYLHLFTLGN